MNPYVLEIFARMRQAELLAEADRQRRAARRSLADLPAIDPMGSRRDDGGRRERAGLPAAAAGRAVTAIIARFPAFLFAGRRLAPRREVARRPDPA